MLEIRDLIIDYGIIRAVKGINMDVNEGTIVAILGANGAGKSTTIRSISGIVKVKSGKIHFDGENIVNKDPFRITAMGIVQSPEGRLILNGLTVEENLLVGAYSIKKRIIETSDETGVIMLTKSSRNTIIKGLLDEVYGYFPILHERRKQQASTLSGGEQQMLAIGRALMGNPKLLLLDEPSLGLAPLIVRDIFEIIKRIKEQGRTILIVEQNAFQTLKIADYGYILALGKIVSEGSGEKLLKDEQLVNAYLGSSH
ncbi:MAG: ABC transporter ATP-binding protein [Tenericutes bacterium GWC2_39_45]|nr:MAG: ABC transporter ATP-binding protein [Tenericutes bacterium GWA2_38_26]OHE31151.1 MAG: ABC transporter ATP-binding protein [Tenericutes bacterium GWC2_39_45]OHE32364.1 MAG: ABC transporter ATP-binding protein [Tenericutes bacterium GWD2_38_27]HBG33068.1 ABC transporter ATP-binding protein [Acholeplasmataceae bacterium]HCB66559.1 ABC transporter ATP-binding protein [Acholeplasmataceae bacterium]